MVWHQWQHHPTISPFVIDGNTYYSYEYNSPWHHASHPSQDFNLLLRFFSPPLTSMAKNYSPWEFACFMWTCYLPVLPLTRSVLVIVCQWWSLWTGALYVLPLKRSLPLWTYNPSIVLLPVNLLWNCHLVQTICLWIGDLCHILLHRLPFYKLQGVNELNCLK